MFRCGQYVHHKTDNLGAGRIVRITLEQFLTDQDTIESAIIYTVTWLDQRIQSRHMTEDLVASAHSVPKFTTKEEADAWLEGQLSGGGWVGTVEDTNAVVAEAIDQAAQQLVAEASTARVRCGSSDCGCMDCVGYFDDEKSFQHSASAACGCEDRGCPCSR